MATLIWLRLGERQAASGARRKYDASAFARLLPTLRKLSAFKRPKAIIERLREACWAAGVQVTCARAPEGCRASGASWFDADGNPVIHLSFRYLSEDHFWFTFFHESAHVLLHGSDHIDGDGVLIMGNDTERQEVEANDYARDIILPTLSRERLLHGGVPSPRSIMRVAREIGVTPGLIVGQLERDEIIPPGRLSSMKRRYRWVDDQLVPDLRD